VSRAQRRTWTVFALCAIAAALAFGWIAALVLRLEAREAAAHAEAAHQSALRVALWRMDSWLAPQLAREAARPHTEYTAYAPIERAYDNVRAELRPGEVLTPSPLLSYRSPLFTLHFQYDAQHRLTSPQVPTGDWLDLARAHSPADTDFPECAQRLEALGRAVDCAALRARVGAAEAQLTQLAGCASPWEIAPPPDDALRTEYQSRAFTTNMAQQQGLQGMSPPAPARGVEHGPLLPIWMDAADGGAPRLLFVRRVRVGASTLVQGIAADWTRLRADLLVQIRDLFPAGTPQLERRDTPAGELEGHMLTTVPALLTAPPPPVTPVGWTPVRTVLLMAGLALLLAAVAVGFTMRSTMALGERRARFASAVTHELRTPLTTFRMYSEMLAEGMVQEPAQRAQYLATLQQQADRLSRLVENVLCYARLEDGRYRGRRERIAAAELLARVQPVLEQRAADAGSPLAIDPRGADAALDVDVDAVTQILFNLVDNACKYAAGSPLEVSVTALPRAVELAVRDRGPGIREAHRRAVFRPFERGDREAGDNTIPGIGLGLALARGLARDLGGELRLEPSERGACFVLSLPRAAPPGA
jgi:signal transduction histidine kinase